MCFVRIKNSLGMCFDLTRGERDAKLNTDTGSFPRFRNPDSHFSDKVDGRRMKYKRVFLFFLVFALAFFLVYEVMATQFPTLWTALRSGNEADIERFLADSDRWTGLILLGMLQFIQVISIVIPGAPIHIAGGMVCGALRGYLVCHFMYLFANVAVITAVRKFSGLTELLGNSNKTRVQKALRFLNQGDPSVTILLLCLIPLIPNGIIPYAASQMNIRIKGFAKAVFLGSFYPVLSMVLAGRFLLTGDYLVSGLLVLMNVVLVLSAYRNRERLSAFLIRLKSRRKRD